MGIFNMIQAVFGRKNDNAEELQTVITTVCNDGNSERQVRMRKVRRRISMAAMFTLPSGRKASANDMRCLRLMGYRG